MQPSSLKAVELIDVSLISTISWKANYNNYCALFQSGVLLGLLL